MVKLEDYEVGCAAPGWTLWVGTLTRTVYIGLQGRHKDEYLPICRLSREHGLVEALIREAVRRAFSDLLYDATDDQGNLWFDKTFAEMLAEQAEKEVRP